MSARPERRPVIGIAGADERQRLFPALGVGALGLPVDRHDLQRGEHPRNVEAALLCEARKVAGYLRRDRIGGHATRPGGRRDDEPRAAANQRGEDDVRISDEGHFSGHGFAPALRPAQATADKSQRAAERTPYACPENDGRRG